jgi:hypothetical protein
MNGIGIRELIVIITIIIGIIMFLKMDKIIEWFKKDDDRPLYCGMLLMAFIVFWIALLGYLFNE